MKDFIAFINEMKKTPKGKAILFFGLYAIFFIFVFLFIKLSSVELSYGDDYEKGSPYNFNIQSLLNKNFNYTYDIYVDGILYKYEGKRNNDSELFDFNGANYYKNSNNYLVNNGTWIRSDNPIMFNEFTDISNIKDIISRSSYESMTTYDNGKTDFNFVISTNTINEIFYNSNTDFDEVPNKIIIGTDENRNVNNISFNLNSFCTNNKMCNYSLEIKLNYNNFGEVYSINSPLNDLSN